MFDILSYHYCDSYSSHGFMQSKWVVERENAFSFGLKASRQRIDHFPCSFTVIDHLYFYNCVLVFYLTMITFLLLVDFYINPFLLDTEILKCNSRV